MDLLKLLIVEWLEVVPEVAGLPYGITAYRLQAQSGDVICGWWFCGEHGPLFFLGRNGRSRLDAGVAAQHCHCWALAKTFGESYQPDEHVTA